MTMYRIHWSTGDSDTCHGKSDLFDLLREVSDSRAEESLPGGLCVEQGMVVDKDGQKLGTVETVER